MQPDLATMDEELFHRAVELVHQHRAASVALIQRHLRIGWQSAEALLARMAAETMAVRKMQNGLYLYIHGPIGEEIARLSGFAQEVLAALTKDCLDADHLRAAAIRHGLAEETTVSARCGDQCACATLFEFPVRCFRASRVAPGNERPDGEGEPQASTT
ncbi:DNA translocase FtsK [Cupriavidus necator]